jgi:tetratricopeptide (TPR) repeat protein
VSLVLLAWLACGAGPAQAGLYYSGEELAPLPCQWRGLLNDLRLLRNTAVLPRGTAVLPSLRERYEAEASRLRQVAQSRDLTAGEAGDLGALLLRLGEVEAALEVLRQAHRRYPEDFAIAANLGTAWQLAGDLDRAAEMLRWSLERAPEPLRKLEELHLRLVELRRREPPGTQALDDLFGVRFVDAEGRFASGRMDERQRSKLPSDAVALAQHLALVLPGDGRILWLLGELANAHGDVRVAAEIFEVCVAQFGLNHPELRERRRILREALAQQQHALPLAGGAAGEHSQHGNRLRPKSRRALVVRSMELASLPPVTRDGVNPLPWALLAETVLERGFRPSFPQRLKELDSLSVLIHGYMQPLTEEAEAPIFLLVEFPVACWLCEMPEVTGMVLVEVGNGKTVSYTREQVRVTGRLSLNSADPESFLYTVKEARVVESD